MECRDCMLQMDELYFSSFDFEQSREDSNTEYGLYQVQDLSRRIRKEQKGLRKIPRDDPDRSRK